MARTRNTQLAAVIQETGWSQDQTARHFVKVAQETGARELLSVTRSHVSMWVGGTQPSGRAVPLLCETLARKLGRLITPADIGLATTRRADDTTGHPGLTLDTDPIDALMPLWSNEIDRRSLLSTSAYSVAAAALPLTHVTEIAQRTRAAHTGRTVGMPEVAAVRDMVTAFSAMDERHGGAHGRTALAQYLRDDIATLCRARFRTQDVRAQMLSAASRAVHLLGWKSYDAGRQGLAQRYYLQSYALAAASGLPGHDGFVMRTMAMQGMKLHRPEHCRELAETGLAQARGTVDATTEALFRIVHAHTLAKVGESHAALTETDRAHTLLTTNPGDPTPFWALAWGPPAASVHSRTAKVHETLGDHHTAAAFYTRAARTRPPGTYARIIALDLVAAVEQQLRHGSIDAACTTWNEDLDHMDGVRSARTRKALTRIRTDLAPFHARGSRPAARLDQRAARMLQNDD
ncbi:hypothetical protein [Streptomyces yaizuensis]|uniref:Tat pathway signal protein n=1 Tax=Streptomyces yaizuensis TaxID=2989713 RepID=A0ABQ5NY89_9ACTN|nr:hypothetical protein [Streptomyces sp. YSPA8]GLF95214.1 Tat pathway signal protein [Streptomyces sp. YSPA8]